jgi:hypothetical protein
VETYVKILVIERKIAFAGIAKEEGIMLNTDLA